MDRRTAARPTCDRRSPVRRAIGAMAVWCALAAAIASGCSSKSPSEPIQLDRGMLTIDNRTAQPWSNVEIWINQYYRITTQEIPKGGRFQAPLGSAVSGFGQRFDFGRMQVKDVRLTAKLPDGSLYEVKKLFPASGLAGALGGKR